MSTLMTAAAESAAELSSRIRRLEERMNELERRLGVEPTEAVPREDRVRRKESPAALVVTNPGGTLGAASNSLFGLALAFLLRALTENHILPAGAGVVIGLLYAVAWLVWAARTPAAEVFLAGMRACTSVLILVPLVWEATLRFGALPTWVSGGILTTFATFGLAISWSKSLTTVAWFTSLAAVATNLALLARTHDPVPFAAALLALAAAVEVSACLEHYLGERWVVALAADLVLVFVTYVATRPAGALEAYPAIAPGVAIALLTLLPAIYLGSTIVRTLVRAQAISNFEVGQCVAALLIAAWGAVQVGRGDIVVVRSLGIFCALASAACYLVTFTFLERRADKQRNFHVYAIFGLALALAASGLLLKGMLLTALLGVLAVVFVIAGMNSGRVTLKVHAAAYVLLAAVVSGLLQGTSSRLFGGGGHATAAPGIAAWVSGATALLCYILLVRGKVQGRGPAPLGVAVALAATAFWSTGGLGMILLSPLCRRSGTSDYCPTVLTVLLVVCCLAAAYGARRLDRGELTWVSVGLAVVMGYKLVVQDMHQATAFGVVISLTAYAAALSVLPKLIRRTRASAAGVGTA